jgi:hypothetical protein
VATTSGTAPELVAAAPFLGAFESAEVEPQATKTKAAIVGRARRLERRIRRE